MLEHGLFAVVLHVDRATFLDRDRNRDATASAIGRLAEQAGLGVAQVRARSSIRDGALPRGC